jgi:hypothetical protein
MINSTRFFRTSFVALGIGILLVTSVRDAHAQDTDRLLNKTRTMTTEVRSDLQALMDDAEVIPPDEEPTETEDEQQEDDEEATKKVESALRGLAAIEERLEELQTFREAEKAEKLLLAGAAVGAAFAFEYHFIGEATKGHPDASVLPYVGFLPGYWGDGDPSQEVFCAKRYWGTRIDGSQSAADALARKQAALLLDALVAARKTYGENAMNDVLDAHGVFTSSAARDLLKKAINVMVKAQEGSAEYKNARVSAQNLLAAEQYDWRIGRTARCTKYMFGFWLGRPLGTREFQPQDDDVEGPLEYTPLVASGLLMSPNYNVTVLVGASLSRGTSNDRIKAGIVVGAGLQADLISIFR